MGYRSDVAFCFKKTPELVIPLSLDKIEDSFSWDDVMDIGDSILYHVSSIKWYEDFEDVRKVMEFLNSLEFDDYLFIRLGEEDADVETQGNWWDNPFELGYIRQITFVDPK